MIVIHYISHVEWCVIYEWNVIIFTANAAEAYECGCNNFAFYTKLLVLISCFVMISGHLRSERIWGLLSSRYVNFLIIIIIIIEAFAMMSYINSVLLTYISNYIQHAVTSWMSCAVNLIHLALQAFSIAGLTVWNALSVDEAEDIFRWTLNTAFWTLDSSSIFNALEVFCYSG